MIKASLLSRVSGIVSSTPLRMRGKMRSETPNFRVVNLAFDHSNLAIGVAEWSNRLYTPLKGGIIYPFDHSGHSTPPFPRVLTALPGASCFRLPQHPHRQQRHQSSRGCAQAGSRGVFATTHNEFWLVPGLCLSLPGGLCICPAGCRTFVPRKRLSCRLYPRRRYGAT